MVRPRRHLGTEFAPEGLQVAVPFLCIQPLVENAVRHGLESPVSGGRIRIVARDQDQECVIEVEDDGAREDPDVVRRAPTGPRVDARVPTFAPGVEVGVFG